MGNNILKGKIILKSGLHIGGEDVNKIGGVDNQVIKIRNNNQNYPYIPGSSLKGKFRFIAKNIDLINGDKINEIFENIQSSVIFRDCFLSKEFENFSEKDLFEVKPENKIDNGRAVPRFIERVKRGISFDFEIVLKNKNHKEDLKKIAKELSNKNYLGGSGTRGYGWVDINFEDENN